MPVVDADLIATVQEIAGRMRHDANMLQRAADNARNSKPIEPAQPKAAKQAAERWKDIARQTAANGGALPIGEAKILAACIQYPAGLDREQLTVLTGYKKSSRDAYVNRLSMRGYVETTTGKVSATDAGRRAMPDAQPLPTGPALQRHWLERLPAGESKILGHLLSFYPGHCSRDEISRATGYKKSSRDAYLNRLAKRELIDVRGGEVRATEVLFQ